MNARTIGYWLSTGLFSLALGAAGLAYLTHAPFIVEAVSLGLGYPEYFLTILGTAKVLGAIALMTPAFPKLKEWAYAGFTFNLIGATWSHVASGDPAAEIAPPVVLLVVLFASYSLRPRDLQVEAAEPAEGGVPLTA